MRKQQKQIFNFKITNNKGIYDINYLGDGECIEKENIEKKCFSVENEKGKYILLDEKLNLVGIHKGKGKPYKYSLNGVVYLGKTLDKCTDKEIDTIIL